MALMWDAVMAAVPFAIEGGDQNEDTEKDGSRR